MVLPASPPPDQQGQGLAPWVEPIAEAFRGLDRGLLVLVDHASNARLGELVRGLLVEHPDLEVVTEAPTLEDLPVGSFVILAVRSEDATWLNLKRPIFKERALNVVLWSSKKETALLGRCAPDFADWITRRFECPPGPPPHAVMGLRAALCARAIGIRFRGTGLDQVFEAALPGRKLVRASASGEYPALLDAARGLRRDWIAWTNVRSRRDIDCTYWALAEAGRRRPFVLENDRLARDLGPFWDGPDLWFVHGQLARLKLARAKLAAAGAPFPGRLAALLGLEPEVIGLTVDLLRRDVTATLLEETARSSPDPGVAITRLAVERGVSSLGPRRTRSPNFRRAFARDGRTQQEPRLGEPFSTNWAHHVNAVHALLREGARSPERWHTLALRVLDYGYTDVARVWAARASTTIETLVEAKRADPAPSDFYLAEVAALRALLSRGLSFVSHAVILRLEARMMALSPQPTQGDWWLYGDVALEVAQASLRAGRWLFAADLFARGGAQPWAHRSEWVSAAFLEGQVEALLQAGEAARAEAVARSALAESDLPLPHLVGAHRALARVLAARGRFDEAENEWRLVVALLERELPGHPTLGSALVGLADALTSQGRHAEAEPVAARALQLAEKHAHHPDRAAALRLLAAAHSVLGLPDAPELAGRALSALREAFGEDHPLTQSSEPHLRRILGDADPPA